jgi:carbonic anhydrase
MQKPAVVFSALALLASPTLAEDCKTSDHWSYTNDHGTGPACWATVDPKNKTCKTGQRQSPIDLKQADMRTQPSEVTETPGYTPVPLKVVNNGHTVQIEIPDGQTYAARQYGWSDGGAVKADAAPRVQEFKLAQIHFHTPSEHRISGQQYPLEAHMVHLGPGGQKLVRGVLFREGDTPHPFLSQLLSADLPDAEGETSTPDGKTIDPSALYAADGNHFEYLGSLTTPDCGEGVTWRVSAEIGVATKDQIEAIRSAIGMDNARPVQALNGREIYLWRAGN